MAAPNKIDPREENILPWDIASLMVEYDEGKQVGESCGIQEIDKIYTMKRGTLSAWGGWANAGKSTFLMFKNLVRAIKYNTKFCWWSHEMINSTKVEGKVVYSASDLQTELIHMFTGKVPYKHWKAKYAKEQMPLNEYREAAEYLSQFFVFINLSDRTHTNVLDNFRYCYEYLGCEGFVGDPWKNIVLPDKGRDDRVMEYALQDFREFAIMYNAFVELVAHPKATNEVKENPKVKNSPFKVPTPNMWLGGSAWDNSMDQLMGVYRKDGADPFTTLFNFKQKKQHLTNLKGEYDNIEYDFMQNRFYFNGVCPIDGSIRIGKQAVMAFDTPWSKNKNNKETNTNDDVPF
jgi:hypothetical protein